MEDMCIDGPKLAFITGIGGQDGSYLSELLLEKGYKVYGIVRRNSTLYNDKNIAHLRGKINIQYGDVNDALGINRYLSEIMQENVGFSVFECIILQDHVVSFEIPDYTNRQIWVEHFIFLSSCVTRLKRSKN